MVACQFAIGTSAEGTEPLVTQWGFGHEEDVNYDMWPDGWRRRQGRDFPAYLQIEIVPRSQELSEAALRADHQMRPLRELAGKLGLPDTWQFSDTIVDRYLRISLNGGAATVQSPQLSVNPVYSFQLSGSLTTSGLKHDQAWIEYLFTDDAGEILHSVSSKKFGGDTPWTYVEFKPVVPPEGARFMMVRLHVAPGDEQDIYGEVGFDNLRIERLPQLRLTTDQAHGLYRIGNNPLASCHVSGLANPVTRLQFRLHDQYGEPLQTEDVQLDEATLSLMSNHQALVRTWQMPSLPPGYYRVWADLYNKDVLTHTTTTSLAVLADIEFRTNPFGWTLASGHAPLTRRDLPRWLKSCGIGCVKYPCWLAPDDVTGADDLTWLLERLREYGIVGIGLLDQPPDVPREHGNGQAYLPLSPQLQHSESWQANLEPLMTRLSMRTTWWQLGDEGDFSFLRLADLPETIDQIRTELQGFGQPIQVALSWPWLEPQPTRANGGWRAISMHDETPLSAKELDAALSNRPESSLTTWVTLNPLDQNRYGLDQRIINLVDRMIALRKHDVPVATISDPFDPNLGILNFDATPGEMLVPWRTAASLIGTLDYAGSIHMLGGSENAVLIDKDRAIMVVSNEEPTQEKIYLGENAKQIDVWGRSKVLPVDADGRHVIDVTRLPTFLVNVDPQIASFRMTAKLSRSRIESMPGRTQTLQLKLSNPFGQAVAGRFIMEAPTTWDVSKQMREISLHEKTGATVPIDIALYGNAAIGPQKVRFDFVFDLEQRRRFSLWRDIVVGPKDLTIDTIVRMVDGDDLVVTVNIDNQSDVSYDYVCYMLTQGQLRRHQRTHISVPAYRQVSKSFVWPDGHQLLGTVLTLKAEDRNSKRVLIYPIPVKLDDQ